MMEQLAGVRGSAWWLRSIAACALALAVGIGEAGAGSIPNAHEGGQGRDKERAALAVDSTSGRAAEAAIVAKPAPQEVQAASSAPADETQPAADDIAPQEADATKSWTRTTSRTVVTPRGIIRSVTRSFSYAVDEEGNKAVAKAFAVARAPNDAAAVENGAGRVIAKTSAEVTGNGAASADAGGSIAVNGGAVEVSTWGRTSAEVF